MVALVGAKVKQAFKPAAATSLYVRTILTVHVCCDPGLLYSICDHYSLAAPRWWMPGIAWVLACVVGSSSFFNPPWHALHPPECLPHWHLHDTPAVAAAPAGTTPPPGNQPPPGAAACACTATHIAPPPYRHHFQSSMCCRAGAACAPDISARRPSQQPTLSVHPCTGTNPPETQPTHL